MINNRGPVSRGRSGIGSRRTGSRLAYSGGPVPRV